jgi:uncharacterized protein YhaN
MLAWLSGVDTLRFKVTEILTKENEVAEKDRNRQQLRKHVVDALKTLGENEEFSEKELAPVVVFAESVLENIVHHKAALEKYHDRQLQAQTALAKAQKEQDTVESTKKEWQEKWDKALAGLGLTDQVLPSEALDLLETIDRCFGKLDKAKEFQSRIDGIDRDVKKFSDDVRILLEQVAPELKDLLRDQAALQMQGMLSTAKQDNELLKNNNKEAELLVAEIRDAENTLQSLNGQLAEFLTIAGCEKAVDLAEAIRKSAEYQRLQEKISNAESSLAKVGETVSLEEIKQQAGEVNVDELPGQIASLRRHIDEELHPQITEILKKIGEENKELQLMDGSGQAAEAAEEMEQVAAKIRRLVDQYTRIKLAAMVLKDEIERYREEHQDPVLQIASKYFADLTLGSFAGLRTDVDDNGNPILVGVRPDDSRLTVDGMSSGTCDQLYLALRMATLEWRLEVSEPMPFIVDDILINFDDERSKATLTALADLSEKNQVILFTHHRQIVDSVKTITSGGRVYVHEL